MTYAMRFKQRHAWLRTWVVTWLVELIAAAHWYEGTIPYSQSAHPAVFCAWHEHHAAECDDLTSVLSQRVQEALPLERSEVVFIVAQLTCWHAEHHTTMSMSDDRAFRIYHNLWVHNGKWYALTPNGDASRVKQGLSVNQQCVHLPAIDAGAFIDNVESGWVPGNTLALDFPFPAFPDNQGHWAELMLPAFSLIQDSLWKNYTVGEGASSPYIDNVLVMNLYREEMISWFQETLKIVLAPVRPPGAPMPNIIDTRDLLHFPRLMWVAFENYFVVTDRYTHEDGLSGYLGDDHGDLWKHEGCERYMREQWVCGFKKPEHARLFRNAAYERTGVPLPSTRPTPSPPLPKVVTFLTAYDGERIVNKYEVTAMLWDVAAKYGWRVHPVTLTNSAPFASQVAMAANTGLLVARHGPLLANAVMLPPGAMVYELLPFNWEWRQISQLYRNMTQSGGEVHHFAWRPYDAKWAVYENEDDARYKTWTADECSSRGCMIAAANAALRVDVEAVRRDIDDILGTLVSGAVADECSNLPCRVSSLRRDWPDA